MIIHDARPVRGRNPSPLRDVLLKMTWESKTDSPSDVTPPIYLSLWQLCYALRYDWTNSIYDSPLSCLGLEKMGMGEVRNLSNYNHRGVGRPLSFTVERVAAFPAP